MQPAEKRRWARLRRHRRVRKKVMGADGRPRLSVFKSGRHIYAQLIDDDKGYTLAAASSLDPEIKVSLAGMRKSEQAKRVGELIAQRAKTVGIKKAVFDRGGYLYHGRVKALAEGARESGLEL